MKNVFMFSMAPEELESMMRKVFQEETQRLQIAKNEANILPDNAKTLDIVEAAALLNLTEGTLRKKIKCKQHPVPHLKQGRALLFRKAELIRWQQEEEQIAKEKLDRKHELQKELDHYYKKRRK